MHHPEEQITFLEGANSLRVCSSDTLQHGAGILWHLAANVGGASAKSMVSPRSEICAVLLRIAKTAAH